MWNLATDPRVKAVVANFGIGWINYYRDRGVWKFNVPYKEPQKTPGQELFLSAVAPQAHASHITAASLWHNTDKLGDDCKLRLGGIAWLSHGKYL